MKPPDWTDAETRTLVNDWLLGRSAKTIAKKIAKTKSAVIGKAMRLYLPRHKNANTGSRKPPAPTQRRPKEKPPVSPPEPYPQETLDLPTVPSPETPLGHGFCCWPLWAHREKISHLYCNQPVRLGSSYCPQHHAQCHIKRIPRDLRVAGKGKERAS